MPDITLCQNQECPMKEKYKLFYGSNFYPSGGWDDFKGHFDSEKEARDHLDKNEPDPCSMWAHIVFEDRILRYASGGSSWEEKIGWHWRDEE